MKVIKQSKTAIHREFTGTQDILDFINSDKLSLVSGGSHCREGGINPWSGTSTFAQAKDLAQKGWKQGVDVMLSKLSEIKHSTAEEVKSYRWDVCGDVFDVGVMLTGQPEHWLHPEPEPSKRIYSIMVNLTVSSSVKPEQIQNRGAAVIALIEKLQDDPSNIVELHITAIFRDCPPYDNTRYDMAVSTTPVPINDVSYMIAHPSMFRRFIFAVAETDNSNKSCGCFGNCADLKDEQQAEYNLYLPCGYAENGLDCFNTIESSAKWVDQRILDFNKSVEC